MPGNRAMFERAMEAYRDALARADWLGALREAVRAAQEFPSDYDARMALGIALYHAGKYPQAINLLAEMQKRHGDDGRVLGYLARALEGQHQGDEAAQVLVRLGELSLRQGRTSAAIEALTDAVRLQPMQDDLRIRLAEILVEAGNPQAAAEQCVAIARLRRAAGDSGGALEAIDEAISLDATNRQAQLLRGQIIDRSASQPLVEPASIPVLGGFRGTGELGMTGPLRDRGLQIDQLVALAGQQQVAGNTTAALATYEQILERDVERNDVFYSMGLLLQEVGEHTRAVSLLRRAAKADEYRLSAYFALGQSLRALQQTREAAEQFEAAISLVDLETIGRAEADDLIAMYEAAGECYIEIGETARAGSLYSTLVAFLQARPWGKELGEQFDVRARALTERSMFAKLRTMGTRSIAGDSVGAGLTFDAAADRQIGNWRSQEADTNSAPAGDQFDPFAALNLPHLADPIFAPIMPIDTNGCSEQLARYVTASSRFVDQGLLYAATDACFEVIRLDPNFLPIHLRLGEIYEREGRNEEALLKYRALIEAYSARGTELEAIDAYTRLLDLAPDTITARAQLAELLRKAGRTDEAVTQALMVATTYFKMGQSNRALEEFRRLQHWAPQSSKIHQQYGEILLKLERLESALVEFRRAVILNPGDLVALAYLNITMAMIGQNERAMWESLQVLIAALGNDQSQIDSIQGAYRNASMILDTPILHYNLGLVQQAAGNHASATLSFEQALELMVAEAHPLPPRMLVHQALAESYLAQDRSQDAIDQLMIALRVSATEPHQTQAPQPFARALSEAELQRRLAAAFVVAGDVEAAIRTLKACIAVDPIDGTAYRQLAALYLERKERDQALEQYTTLAAVFEHRQQLDQAIATLDDALATVPDALRIRTQRAQFMLRRGILERGLDELQAVATLQQAAGDVHAAVDVLKQAAAIYWMLTQHEHVFALYNQIRALDPEDVQARLQSVAYQLMAGQHDGAIAAQREIVSLWAARDAANQQIGALQQLLGLYPDDADAHEQLATLLLAGNEYERARRLVKRLAALRPDDPRTAELLASVEQSVPQPEETPEPALA